MATDPVVLAPAAPARPRRRGLLRNPADAHCLVYHGVALVAYGCAFWLWLHPEAAGITGPWSRAAFVAAAAFMLGWTSGMDVAVNFHNHAHRRVFWSPRLNRWVGRLWTFSGGWPSFAFEHAHVVVHHANLLGPEDWTLPRPRPDGRVEGIIRYSLLHWPWRAARHLWLDFTRGRARHRRREAAREMAIFLALWSIPFWIDLEMALWLWLLPQWIGNVMLMGGGMYAQHVDCEEKSEGQPYKHSNTSLSPWLNYTMFNLGYHIEHHDHPNIHWTDLPKQHGKMRPRMRSRGARVFAFGYHRLASVLSTPWMSDARRRRKLPVLPEFAGGAGEAADEAPAAAPAALAAAPEAGG